MAVKFGLPPIASPSARLFILGSLPGDASLAAGRYYAHPTNQFWRLVGLAIDEEIHSLAYDKRLERLAVHGIGLWDVIASADRRGSLDQAIREAEHNQIAQLLKDYPSLQTVAFNGSVAALIGRKLIDRPSCTLALVDLPSSSAANTKPFDEKAHAWAGLARFLKR